MRLPSEDRWAVPTYLGAIVRMSMLNSEEYSVGWIDGTVHNFLMALDRPPEGMKYALITCLDSCFDLPTMFRESPALQPLHGEGTLLGQGLLVKTGKLLSAERGRRIFFGFDEVWFFQIGRAHV